MLYLGHNHRDNKFIILKVTLWSEIIFDNWKPSKSDEKCFLFQLKSPFRSQDI